MKTNSRRKFIRNTSLTATGILLTSVTVAKKQSVISSAIGCAPNEKLTLFGSVKSVKSGNWSDSETWGGQMPSETDTPMIDTGHNVVYDMEATTVAGININAGATLSFAPGQSSILESTKNIVVYGRLEMKPSSANYIHTIRFIGINEDKVMGSTHDVLASDIGLWSMGAGKLELIGSEKKAWTRLAASASVGASSISLKEPAKGWATGDEIVVCPTREINGLSMEKVEALFERKNINNVSSSTLSLDSELAFDHSKVAPAGSDKSWTAEVLNLTRNVRIEGTEKGRAHVFVRSTSPQTLKYVALRYLGPRREQTGDSIKEFIVGRYGLHFHHCMDGSRGTIVDSCVGYDIGSHVFVPHVSDGITFKDCVAFNALETPFWWDMQDVTNEVVYDGCVVALSKFVNGAGSTPTRRSAGFLFGMGDDNVCINCVSVSGSLGGTSNTHTTGAFVWEANNEGLWIFENCLSHSDFVGLRGWQNTHKNHTIENFDSYNNVLGIFHGAYGNSYTYRGGYHYNSPIEVKASSSNTSGVRFEHIVVDGAGKIDYPVIVFDAPIPTANEQQTNKFLFCTVKNFKVGPVLGSSTFTFDSDSRKLKYTDFICCDLGGKLPTFSAYAENGCWMRVQPKTGQPKKIEKVGTADSNKGTIKVTDIAAFAPYVWGRGDGLLGEYFDNTKDLQAGNKVHKRVDSLLAFKEWEINIDNPTGVHYKIKSDVFSMRWTGKLMAQSNEEYTFKLNSAGGSRLWLNGKLIIDAWSSEGFRTTDRWASYSDAIKLEAGKLYDIKIEHYNAGGYKGFLLSWMAPSMKEYYLIPQSQLFSGKIATTPGDEQPTDAITANAGEDIELTLPENKTTLNGSASTGKLDGSTYKWSKVSGPSQYTLANATTISTTLSNLVEGSYVFKLEIKDKEGKTYTDEVTINVKAAGNQKPKANAGDETEITLPNNAITLNGSSSTDADGKVVSYKWTKINGPSHFKIANPIAASTLVTELTEGVYTFRLEVKDDKGETSTDDIRVTVNEAEEKQAAPKVSAGSDQLVTLPTNNAKLSGRATAATGLAIKSYKWTKISGPNNFKIVSPDAVSTTVNQLVEGTYVFQLEATDTAGNTGKDFVEVEVEKKQSSTDPNTSLEKEQDNLLVSVSPNPSTSVFRVHVKSNSDRPVTLKLYDKWGKEVGNMKNVKPGSSVTIPSNLKRGTYFGVAEQGFQKKTMTLIKL